MPQPFITKDKRLETFVEPSRVLDVVADADVVVVGGGPSGITAAIAAAREGVRTLLIERYGFLGGAGTMAGVTNFCGLYRMEKGVPIRTVQGISMDFTDTLVKSGRAVEAQASMGGKTAVFPYNSFAFKRTADHLLTQYGVALKLHRVVAGTIADNGIIRAVITESKSGREAVSGRIFIDASGDADLAAFAGAPYHKGDKTGFMQLPTTMFLIGGVDGEKAETDGIPEIKSRLMEAETKSGNPFPRLSVIVRPQPDHGIWRANMTRISREGLPIDGVDADDLTYGEIEGRRQVELYAEFLRKRIPGFENSFIIESAPEIGIRETRRIEGEYVIREDDVMGGTDFSDSIGCNAWPIERHTFDRETQWSWIPGRGYHQIPYRSMLPKKVDNLLVAGRCISTDSVAQSSLRVSGPCFAMGHAAGLAAAICVKNKEAPRQIDVAYLQTLLKSQGAIIG
ncbi:FAD-dependent oxidoreductase [Desulfobacula sp.]|uniref:FAD-dependent oxidoreductase n=1 Tax=Desulfobacula sp. TaxID=2593537 RepID=UPI00261E0EDB|nr:FAD-dependent oxidoreductase [Desulfobacula sp.]